ncbi:hypothetical protein B0T25DRAFT_617361 [Lasiosphaeria hispida]|uniref:Copper acquisition factor BIM1-like domain-containing protein n=1 Tax=Lasiosphaeria hispida TaxID=260671 RepID=A0AAJ0M8P9_9PEZI|nr:hypothetical protein B0T25DRAFT_617361 [Lasiosphaeria hispida]
MVAAAALILLAVAQLTTAHFGLPYPAWRYNTLNAANTSYSQWTYPCAGVPGNLPNGNRTDWPLKGGSIKIDLHHDWTYVFINIGLGANVSNFNYTLTPEIWNATGKGILCVPELTLPTSLSVVDGTEASIQVVTVGASGSALYNCADITFRSSAAALSGDECKTDGVTLAQIEPQVNGSSTPPKSAGSIAGVNNVVLSSVVGLALVFVYGMGL